VFASDHGEGLAETPRLPAHHGDLLYQPLVHVPLAFRVPGVPGARLETPATTADIYPTLLDLAGLPHPGSDGVSLAPLLLEPNPGPMTRLSRPIYMMEARQHALVIWPLKLIKWKDRGRVELYDLAEDPGEEEDLAPGQPEDARRMAALLQARKLVMVDRMSLYKARRWREGAPDEPGAFTPPSGQGTAAGKQPGKQQPGAQGEQGGGGKDLRHRGEGGEPGQQRRRPQGEAGETGGTKRQHAEPRGLGEGGAGQGKSRTSPAKPPRLKGGQKQPGKKRRKGGPGGSPEDHLF